MKFHIDIDGSIGGTPGAILAYGTDISGHNVFEVDIPDYDMFTYSFKITDPNNIQKSDFTYIAPKIDTINTAAVKEAQLSLDDRESKCKLLLAYMTAELTDVQFKNFYTAVRQLKQDYIDGYPTLPNWIANTADIGWGIDYTANTTGFKSKAYYSDTRRDACLKILNS